VRWPPSELAKCKIYDELIHPPEQKLFTNWNYPQFKPHLNIEPKLQYNLFVFVPNLELARTAGIPAKQS
jgi:hypothetical protein